MGSSLHVLVAPDAFKGSLTAQQAAAAIRAGVIRAWPDAAIACLPIADGGEGTLDVILQARSGERRSARVSDAAGEPLMADYGVLPDGTAVIEVARVVGFTQPGIAAVPLTDRTTGGVGELLRHCLDQGLRRFVIGLGGSSTNDGGMGMLAALGMRLSGPRGQIESVDWSGLDPRLPECHILLVTDVDNPLCGEQGASHIYGPQKGAGPEEVLALDTRLRRFSQLADAALANAPGTGAAGGLGYALQYLGGEYRAGAEVLLDLLGFDAALKEADWVITGEGRSDLQTLHGKAPCIAAQHARAAGVRVALLSGSIDPASDGRLATLFEPRLAMTDTFTTEQAIRDPALCLERAACWMCERISQVNSGTFIQQTQLE